MTASLSQLDTLIDSTPTRQPGNVLPTPAELRRQIPLDHELRQTLTEQRQAIQAILDGEDDRLLVVVGPCSVHDPRAVLEYAERLAALARRVEDRLLLVMRVYVEKPRTTVGWKGLAYDPHLDGSDDMAHGLALSRRLMRDVARLGLPVASELLQPMAVAYFDDLLAWAAVGARTTESQIHREMVSGLEAIVGFKNATHGGVGVAIDAMRAAAHGHRHFGMDLHGRPVMHETQGNAYTHLVLRGGHGGPNYDAESVADSRRQLEEAGLRPNLMVDCSHANSRKDHRRQSEVLLDVLAQRLAGETALVGVMLESHLNEGKQALEMEALRYGVSVTDACLGWETTEQLLDLMAARLRDNNPT
ncbi:3-deoxy-7-phosphoheptulonate synthase [Halomonas sp. McH1-25]|uniref:3-deoxy-7-phosphoheptulonate synthase n=1 Tax=unclassified Halomonas TaxID=2609666 RepID=UPI001EF6B993|nr:MULTISPECIES: 3-deoxy-7-phosphoheptulonate synthase [unclassified Halomonas]MCG7601623.1 3-deoxy-7-phosphoheptulonate synthase [Halomonas sp. McH1-25]MCP1342256.1 3-deoxy-7-phosphoheptulonate synthase [Halomonas sp. FL8]MCP1360527.1 3-deoxy-7-phosphoheptulonate synthase [Halomonas sp. BBD45]